jgi:hypothetical protein
MEDVRHVVWQLILRYLRGAKVVPRAAAIAHGKLHADLVLERRTWIFERSEIRKISAVSRIAEFLRIQLRRLAGSVVVA